MELHEPVYWVEEEWKQVWFYSKQMKNWLDILQHKDNSWKLRQIQRIRIYKKIHTQLSKSELALYADIIIYLF